MIRLTCRDLDRLLGHELPRTRRHDPLYQDPLYEDSCTCVPLPSARFVALGVAEFETGAFDSKPCRHIFRLNDGLVELVLCCACFDDLPPEMPVSELLGRVAEALEGRAA